MQAEAQQERETAEQEAARKQREERATREPRPKRVRLRFTAEASRWVREKQWHPTQRLHERPNGKLALNVLNARKTSISMAEHKHLRDLSCVFTVDQTGDHLSVPFRGAVRSINSVVGGSVPGSAGGEKGFWHMGHHICPATGWKSNSTPVPQVGQEAECITNAPVTLSGRPFCYCLGRPT